MKIYNYNKQGIFTKESEAKIDPLETKLQKKNVYLIPARATAKAIPKLKAGEIAVFDGENWKAVSDIRGAYYNTETKEKIIVSDLNMEISGLTKEVPPEFEDYCTFLNDKWVINEAEKTELTASREKEILIQQKQNEILRRQAISELENEGKI